MDVHGEAGREWLADLPATAARWAGRWDLSVGAPFPGLGYAWVAPAVRSDGSPAVLKLGVPGDPTLGREAAALRHFRGRGAVRLLEEGPGALLLERAVPGDPLADVADEDDDRATRAAAGVMGRILDAAGDDPPDAADFTPAEDLLQAFTDLRARHGGGSDPLPPGVLDRAVGAARELLADGPGAVPLHGDLHHGNVLRADREPWLAVDPKGVLAEPAWEAGALLRNPPSAARLDPGGLRALTARRVAILADHLPVDRHRVLAWAGVQAVLASCWMLEDHGAGWEPWVTAADVFYELAG